MESNYTGRVLGNYRLIRLLGQGGFAAVYLAEHCHLRTYAAVKLLHNHLAQQSFASFEREAQMLASLQHNHILHVYDFGLDEGFPYIIMDYAPGGSLRERHRVGTRVPLPTVVSYVNQISSALYYTHKAKLIHCDIKPENMLLDSADHILLSDFGIGTIAHDTASMSTQEVIGSVHYMAPEQIHGKPRPASDQYALGIVVYEWLCGKRPFTGDAFIGIAMQQVNAPPPPLRDEVPSLPTQVEQVVLKALAKTPEHRYPTIQEFAIALAQAASTIQQIDETVEIILPLSLQHSSAQITKTTPVNTQTVTELPDPTANMFNQALLCIEQWRYAEAEPLLQQVLLAHERQLGNYHSETARCLNTISTLFIMQRRFKEADQLLHRAISIYKRQAGSTYAGMASSLNTLGRLYLEQFRFKEAKQSLQQALVICEQYLGPNDLETATCLYELGNLSLKQLQLKEAEQFHQRALAIREQQLGLDHPETARSLVKLAVIYEADQDIHRPTETDYTEVERLYQQVFAIREQQLGPNHPETAQSLNSLGGVYQDMKHYTEAEQCYRNALSIHEQYLGSDHPETAADLKSLGMLYEELKYYADAEHFYQKALAIYERQLGSHAFLTGTILFSLARLYHKLERSNNMKRFARRALKIYKQSIGSNHPVTRRAIDSYNRMRGSAGWMRIRLFSFVHIEEY